MNWTRVVEPVLDPVTLDEAKHHCRQEYLSDDDEMIRGLLLASTNTAEQYLHRGLMTQSMKAVLDDWRDVVWLPSAAPLQSITSVKYRASDGTLTTLASSAYVIDTVGEPGRLMRAPNMVWPALQADRLGGIEITYVVGWSQPADVPQAIKLGQLRLLVHWFGPAATAGRGETAGDLPAEVESLWAPYRVWTPFPCC